LEIISKPIDCILPEIIVEVPKFGKITLLIPEGIFEALENMGPRENDAKTNAD
jgi:hypothetical protein